VSAGPGPPPKCTPALVARLARQIEQHPTISRNRLAVAVNLAPDAPLFPASRQAFYIALNKAAQRAGIARGVHAHQYRHRRASKLVDAGVPDAHIMELMGWRDPAMVLCYHAPTLETIMESGRQG